MKEKKQCLSLTLSAYEFSPSMLFASKMHDEDNVVVVMLCTAYMCQAVVKYDVVKVYVRGIFGDIKSVQNLHLNQQVVPCFNSVFPHNIAESRPCRDIRISRSQENILCSAPSTPRILYRSSYTFGHSRLDTVASFQSSSGTTEVLAASFQSKSGTTEVLGFSPNPFLRTTKPTRRRMLETD